MNIVYVSVPHFKIFLTPKQFMPNIGFNLCGHDASIFYIDSVNQQLFGLDTERVTRVKHDHALQISPINILSQQFNLKEPINFSKSHIRTIYFVYYPLEEYDLKFRNIVLSKTTTLEKIKRLLTYKPWHLPVIALHHSLPTRLKVEMSLKFSSYGLKLYTTQFIKQCGIKINQINEYDHHTCHAASSYYLSPYTDALSVTLDEFGDNYASKIFKCNSNKMDSLYGTLANFEFKENNDCLPFGYMYSRATKTLGLIPNSDEEKWKH